MKIDELRKKILKNDNALQKPKYIVLGNEDYAELMQEMQDMCRFLGFVRKTDTFFDNIQLIAESEFLDLRTRPGCLHLNTYSVGGASVYTGTFCQDCRAKIG